eukprot:125475-Amphidinium_carterae.1
MLECCRPRDPAAVDVGALVVTTGAAGGGGAYREGQDECTWLTAQQIPTCRKNSHGLKGF